MARLVNYPMCRLPTNQWGLSSGFSVFPSFRDEDDWTDLCTLAAVNGPAFSAWNQAELTKLVEPWMSLIVEIGVSRDGWEFSSTRVLLEQKPATCHYIGIDIGDRDWVASKATNVAIIRNSSYDVQNNLQQILALGRWIDLLLIDGDHSVNSVLKEWEYAKFVRPNGGVIVLHDTNFHPGPWCMCECVDTSCFEVRKLCETADDWGMGVLRRL